MKDLYQALGVPDNASDADIKKAYRKLAREFHPDATGGDKRKTERFKEVTEAHTILGDTKKRGEYDRLRRAPVGADGMPQGFDEQTFSDIFGAGGMRGRGGRVQMSGDMGDMGDIFASLFGGGRGGTRGPFGRGGAGRSEPRGADLSGRLDISFAEAVLGGKRTVTTGAGKTIEVAIPAGVESGGRLRVPGQGAPSATGKSPAGDLFLEIAVLPDPHLRREGSDVELELPVSLREALLGAEIEVPTVEGKVRVTVPAGTSSGRKLRLRGRGTPRADGGRGDQLCRIQIVVPRLPEGDAVAKDQLRTLLEAVETHAGKAPIRSF